MCCPYIFASYQHMCTYAHRHKEMLYSSIDCFLFDVECVPDNSIINNSNNTAITSTTANDNDAIRLHTIPFVFVFKTHMLPHHYTRDARKKMNEYILYRKSVTLYKKKQYL